MVAQVSRNESLAVRASQRAEDFENSEMPQIEANTVVVLLSCCLGLVALMTLLLLGVSARVRRIEKLLIESAIRQEIDDTPSVAETSPGGAFENFLKEDPSRRSLTKSEQFAAYRQWRHEKGMNWSNS